MYCNVLNLIIYARSRTLDLWQWVDYSNRFGFGYQLSDKSVGLLFNDSTRIGCTKDRYKQTDSFHA
jgi:hypothetical protein